MLLASAVVIFYVALEILQRFRCYVVQHDYVSIWHLEMFAENNSWLTEIGEFLLYNLLEPEILGDHNISNGTTLVLKTIMK